MRSYTELYHHGILGQKWGVRRYQNVDGTYTDLGRSRRRKGESPDGQRNNKKKYAAIGATAVATALAVVGGVYLYKKINGSGYKVQQIFSGPLLEHINNFSDSNSVSLKAGTTFSRVSSKAIEDYSNRGEAYVSHLLRDNARYKDRIPKESYFNGDSAFIHRIKFNKDIKAPSSKVAAEIFLKLNPKATHAEYINFMTYGIRDNSAKRDSFIKELKRLGFNAVIDENDYGWTKSPLIVFNPKELISNDKVHSLSIIEEVISTLLI